MGSANAPQKRGYRAGTNPARYPRVKFSDCETARAAAVERFACAPTERARFARRIEFARVNERPSPAGAPVRAGG